MVSQVHVDDASSVSHNALLGALDRAMAIAEFSAEGILLNANPNYLLLLGYSRDNALGLHHRSFCKGLYADSEAYRLFWAGLLASQTFSGICERRRGDGSTCWLEATYTAILDKAGNVERVVKVATDISLRHQRESELAEHNRRLSLVAGATDSGVLIVGADWRIQYVNSGFSRMFGWQQEDLAERSPIELLAANANAHYIDYVRLELLAGRSVRREEIVVGKSGQRYWINVVANPVLGEDGRLVSVVSVLTDITQSKMYEVLQHNALEAMASEQPLAQVLELICREVERIAPEVAASILEVDEHGCLQSLAAPSLPAAYSAALCGVPIGPSVGSCGTAAFRNDAVLVTDIANDPLWADYKHLALELGYVGCWSTPIRSSQGRVIGTFAFYFREALVPDLFHQQIVNSCVHLCALALQREHARARIRQLAFYDALTGLPNRSLLQARADQAISAARRDSSQLAVLFVDLDRFKKVNDSLGHPAGDELLRIVAGRLERESRESDIVGRLSGDEFVLILPDCDSTQVAAQAEQQLLALGAPCLVDGVSVACSASIGISVFPGDGRDMETLLRRADMAMYQAKSGGRGQLSFFSHELNLLAQERLALETALREALQNNGLRLHYQPQIDLASGQLCGVEALARWTHPQLGEISPARFIPLAEECGLIADLGRWVLAQACRQLSDWRRRALAIPSVSINLSPTSFHNLDLPRMIADTLDHHGLVPRDLTLEITEGVLLDTNPSTLKTIDEVHAQGVRLSMDDFGTGYSSLSYLRRLPLSELKLDRSFVSDLEDDSAARALSAAIMGIGKSLNLTVVAEGVETAGQCLVLKDQGYSVAQGYLFARPLAPESLEAWLSAAMA